MPVTPQSFVIDPQGVSVAVDIRDVLGGAVTVYSERDGSTPVSLPTTISAPTEFFFASGHASRELSATQLVVSAKFNDVEVAGPNGTTAIVEAHNWQPEHFVVNLANGGLELANLLDAAGGGGGGSGLPSQWTDGGNGNVTATTDDNVTALTIGAFAGQTVPLLDLKDENGVDIFTVGPTGAVEVLCSNPLLNGQFVVTGAAGSADNDSDLVWVQDEFSTKVMIITANGGFSVSEQDPGQDGVKLRSHGTTLHLGQYGENYASSLLIESPSPGFSVEGNPFGAITRWTTLGDFIIKGTHAAPADATLADGECGIWFDQTVDATKIKFKAKDSAGTIRTGEVALT